MKILRPWLYLLSFAIGIALSSCSSNTKNNRLDSLNKKNQDSLSAVKTNKQWLGDWERDDFQNEADIDITKITADSLTFTLNAVSGGHTGAIEGHAFIQSDKAYYSSKDALYKSGSESPCSLSLTLKGDSIIIIDAKNCEDMGGMGVDFDGKFVNPKYISKTKKKQPAENLVRLEILNPSEDSVFRKLVGKSYETFINSTQLTDEDVKDLDDMHAKIRSSGVRGMFTYMENIIMVDSAQNICAAVLDDEKVYYFTNNKNYLYQLPKTIEDWRSRFKQYPVIYHSQK